MLEEERREMEKKILRLSVPPRTSLADTRKDSLVAAGKRVPRFNKQYAGRNGADRNQPLGYQGNRSTPQKFPYPVDKRPRPRTSNNSGQEQEVTQVTWVDHNLVDPTQVVGSKKGNLNHLLNFKFASRDMYGYYGGGNVSGSYKQGKWHNKRHVHYNKEQYLQASCQFVVNEFGDYLINTSDPDVLVNWDCIEQIRIFSHEIPSCPICLCLPIAAKITRCGHIYCWSCMLHYLSLGEKMWSKCPICYDAVYQKDLKSVVAVERHMYTAGDKITMNLMKRLRGSTYAMPVSQWTASHDKAIHHVTDKLDLSYCKLLIASANDIDFIINEEREILREQLIEEGGPETLEGSFVQAALDLLNERKEILQINVSRHKSELPVCQQPSSSKDEATIDCCTTAITTAKSNHKQPDRDRIEYVCAFSDNAAVSKVAECFPQNDNVFEQTPFTVVSEAILPIDTADTLQSVIGDTFQNVASVAEDTLSSVSELTLSDDMLACVLNDAHGSDYNSSDGDIKRRASNDSSQSSISDTLNDVITGHLIRVSVTSEQSVNDDVLDGEMSCDFGEKLSNSESMAQGVSSRVIHHGADDIHYFYQAADGQYIYLHSLNVQCLINDYKSLSMCPETITATVVEVETFVMTTELRRRLRYLNHLPLNCEFQVVELLLQKPLVSAQTLDYFYANIEKRKQNRIRKNKEEKRRLRKMQEEEDRRCGKVACEASTYVKSSFRSTNDEGGTSASAMLQEEGLAVSVAATDVHVDMVSGSPFNDGTASSCMSFARMLKEGKAVKIEKGATARRSSEEDGGGNKGKPKKSGEAEGSDNEDNMAAPFFQNSFGDAIQQALDNFNATSITDVDNAEAGSSSSSGKKKKVPTATLR